MQAGAAVNTLRGMNSRYQALPSKAKGGSLFYEASHPLR